MGKKMLPVSLGLAAAVLSGCMGEAAEPVVEAPAFHFASGTLELGDFDPATLGDDLFDPCTEISAEEYAAAGMTGVEPEPVIAESSNGLAEGCKLDKREVWATRSVLAARTDLADVQDADGYVVEHPDSVVPELYTHTVPSVNPYQCVAQVDTVRGGLAVAVSVSGLKKDEIDVCEDAKVELEDLFNAVQDGER